MPSALVLAAGQSRRMGCLKLVLPWNETTVLGQVVATLQAASLTDIVVVTGHRAEETVQALAGSGVIAVHNADYAAGEMVSSIQVGLAALGDHTQAALLCLGDQPQMQEKIVRAVLAEGEACAWQHIIIPSYQMRAGHPILLPRFTWAAVLSSRGTLRDVLSTFREQTRYLVVDTPTILADLDTPEDYDRERSYRGGHI